MMIRLLTGRRCLATTTASRPFSALTPHVHRADIADPDISRSSDPSSDISERAGNNPNGFYEGIRKHQRLHPSHLLMARVGDFYEFYFEQAATVSASIGLKLAVGKYRGQEHVFCGFPMYKMSDYVRLLMDRGHSVAKYEQYSVVQSNGQPLITRRVDRIFSRGSVVEEDLLAGDEGGGGERFIMALDRLSGEDDVWRFACADLGSGKFFCDQVPLSQLPHVLAGLPLAECLVVSEIGDSDDSHGSQAAVREMIGRTDASVLAVDSRMFDGAAASRHLRSLFSSGPSFGSVTGGERGSDSPAVGCLLNYLAECHGGHLPLLSRPRAFDRHRLKIDSETASSLELTRTMRRRAVAGTLLHAIDDTVTAGGRKELVSRLSAPFTSRPLVDSHLNLVHRFMVAPDLRVDTRSILSRYFKFDSMRAVQNMKLDHAGPWHLAVVYDALVGVEKLTELFRTCRDLSACLDALSATSGGGFPVDLEMVRDVKDLISRALPACLDGGGEVLDSLSKSICQPGFLDPGCNSDLLLASERLSTLGSERDALEVEMRKRYGIHDGKIRLDYKKPFGAIVEVDATCEELDRMESSKDFKLLQSLAASKKRPKRRYLFHPWTTLEIRQRTLEADFAQTELRTFQAICAMISDVRKEMEQISNYVALIDVASSFASLSIKYGYTRPEMTQDGQFEIEGGFHPVVHAQSHGRNRKFQHNDCMIHSPSSPIVLVTGANMGGKSTFLRQNALIVVMSHIGCFVPAKRARIGMVDQLFSRIGSSDDISRNESSFMVEMNETAFIMNNATMQSFAILDEVGRGTSYEDGVSIAHGILKHISSDIKCRTLFATHYTPLVQEMESSCNEIRCLESAIETRQDEEGRIVPTFTYRFRPGIATNSHGIFIAELAGIPETVISEALKYRHNKFP